MTRKYSLSRAFAAQFPFFFLFTVLSSCLGTKYLEEDQLLLYEQQIVGAEKVSPEALNDFYRQEANVRPPFIPWAPYVSIYNLGQKFFNPEKLRQKRENIREEYNEKIAEAEREGRDSRLARLRAKKEAKLEKIERELDEGNILMRIGEPITVYDSTLARQSAEEMEQFLHNNGFFNAEVFYTTEIDEKLASVTYHVIERQGYLIDTIWLVASNEKIRYLIASDDANSYLSQGELYNQADLAAERNRINDLLRDNGYYDFSQQFIEFNVDTTLGDHRVSVVTEILRPSWGYHRQYVVDSVVFVTDATARGDIGGRKNKQVSGINYLFLEEQYSKRVLSNRVFIRPDCVYSKSRTLETQKQLANLDNFKFVNINYDSVDGKFVSYIYANPLKRFQMSQEAGVTYSVGIPGPFYNTTWVMRNVFGGLENLEFSLNGSIEGIPSPIDDAARFRSKQFGGNLSLVFPQFLIPIVDNLRYRLGRYNPKTRFLVGANFTDRQVFRRNTFSTSLNYTWQTDHRRKTNFYNRLFTFVPVDISVINSDFGSNQETNPFYQQLLTWLQQGNPYIYSFNDSFVSSMYAFIIFNKNSYGSYTEEARYIRPFIESGGTTQNLFDFGFVQERGLATYKFLKFSNDYRKFYPLSDKSSLAWRVNGGIAVPYGDGGIDTEGNQLDPTLPYEKFFFAGGSNSIRAFRPRRLGPGIYSPALQPGQGNTFINNIEQPGEILLEASIEHRHNIFGFLNGAVFLDAGNVWRLRETEALTGGKFEFDSFYRQIALGTGYGFRLDFTFLIVRADLGLKLYNPQSVKVVNGEIDYSAGWIWDDNYGSRPMGGSFWDQDPIVLNIGIGYPF